MQSSILLEKQSSFETRAVLSAVMLSDAPPRVLRSHISELKSHADSLKQGACVPVGSVEFVRAALALAAFAEPPNMGYPPELLEFLGRTVSRVSAKEARESKNPIFIKPHTTKKFTGFVFRPGSQREDHSEHYAEQLEALYRVPDAEAVWCCAPVSFLSEWRFYVRGRKIWGSARYDAEGLDSAPEPVAAVVQAALECLVTVEPCALDFGVLASGETVLVEANDFWALGLYGNEVSKSQYLECLQERWAEIAQNPAIT